MSNKPARPCRYPGCPGLTGDKSGYCESHQQQAQASRQKYDQTRGTAAERGYDARWQRYRLSFLAEHPLCVICMEAGRTTESTVVDHITPHRGNQTLFWDTDNHQPLCQHHHNVKTATEDGAFGNPTR